MSTDFGEYLKEKRMKKGFTISQLSLYSGISTAQLSRIENGKRGVPKAENIQKIANALSIPYEEMMEVAGYINYFPDLIREMGIRQGELEKEAEKNYLTETEKEEYELIQEFFKEDHDDDITNIIQRCRELKELNKSYESNKKKKVNVAGREINLTEEELILFNELKKHPIMLHDLASDPERKVKELIKLYKMKKMFLEDDEKERGDGFGSLED